MIFCEFDEIDARHKYLLEKAKSFGDHLAVVVSQDHILSRLIGKYPKNNFIERFESIKGINFVDKVLIGDYKNLASILIKRANPDVVVLSRSQDDIKNEIEKNYEEFSKKIEIKTLELNKLSIF